MKILHTAQDYAPNICGVQEVVQRISEGLANRGHQVTIATTYNPQRDFRILNGVSIEQFDIRGRWTRGGYRGETKRYQQFARFFDCDIMMNYAAQQWASDLVYPLLKQLPFKKVFVPCGYSTLYDWKWKPYFWRLPAVLRKYDHIIYHSDNYRDKEFGNKHGINHCSVIPNGASGEEFLQSKSGFRNEYGITTSQMFLCVASYSHGKNQEMVLRAYHAADISDSTLVFIGQKFNDYSDRLRTMVNNKKGIVCLLEHVPRGKTVSAYHEADLFLFGSKVECFPLAI